MLVLYKSYEMLGEQSKKENSKQQSFAVTDQASRNSLGMSANAAEPTPNIPNWTIQAAVCLYSRSSVGCIGLP